MRYLWLGAVLLLYLALSSYQLGLPGIHYDEAKEAGVNAMELLTGAPVTAFRGAGFTLGGRTLPWMVQDYIGALNVYLVLPFLALTGIGVPNLRALTVLTGLAGLLLLERAVSEWLTCQRMWARRQGYAKVGGAGTPPTEHLWEKLRPSRTGLIAVTLLAISPSYLFWARQGVFVTNLMLPFVFLCLWQGVRWLRTGKTSALALTGLAAGLALYAKLLAVWVVGPFGLALAGWWLWLRIRHEPAAPRLTPGPALAAAVLFLAPLAPLVLFNFATGGTFASIGGNLQQSYYGVNNADVLGNLPVRWNQLVQSLRGDQFWYLGGVFANLLAPWLAGAAVAAGVWYNWRRVLPPLLLTGAALLFSLFTVSNLFVTHFVVIQPLVVAAVAIALGVWLEPKPGRQSAETPTTPRGQAAGPELLQRRGAEAQRRRGETGTLPVVAHEKVSPNRPWCRVGAALWVGGIVLLWTAGNLQVSVQYHRALAASGGLADHSDASYQLAYYLQSHGLGAPLALDWGLDAPVRFLTAGAVTPIEIFGYVSPAAPDDEFLTRLTPFLGNPDNTFLLHAPGATIFQGRREAFQAAAAAKGQQTMLEVAIDQRDGTPLYEIWRVNESPR